MCVLWRSAPNRCLCAGRTGGFGAVSSGERMSFQGRPLPTVEVGYPAAQLGGQLSGGEIARPTGAGRPTAAGGALEMLAAKPTLASARPRPLSGRLLCGRRSPRPSQVQILAPMAGSVSPCRRTTAAILVNIRATQQDPKRIGTLGARAGQVGVRPNRSCAAVSSRSSASRSTRPRPPRFPPERSMHAAQ